MNRNFGKTEGFAAFCAVIKGFLCALVVLFTGIFHYDDGSCLFDGALFFPGFVVSQMVNRVSEITVSDSGGYDPVFLIDTFFYTFFLYFILFSVLAYWWQRKSGFFIIRSSSMLYKIYCLIITHRKKLAAVFCIVLLLFTGRVMAGFYESRIGFWHSMLNVPVIRSVLCPLLANTRGADGKYALERAIQDSDPVAMQRLLDAGAKVPADGLFWQYYKINSPCFDRGQVIDITRLLVQHGADPKARNPAGLDIFSYFACCGADEQSDGRESYSVNKEVVKYLLEHGAQFERLKFSCENKDLYFHPLETAIFLNKNNTARVFLECGANPSDCTENVNQLFIYAVMNNNKWLIEKLSEYVTDFNAEWNPEKCSFNREAFLYFHQVLLKETGDTFKRSAEAYKTMYENIFGCTALMTSIIKDNREILELLIEKGADPYHKTSRGDTVNDVCRHVGSDIFVPLKEKETYSVSRQMIFETIADEYVEKLCVLFQSRPAENKKAKYGGNMLMYTVSGCDYDPYIGGPAEYGSSWIQEQYRRYSLNAPCIGCYTSWYEDTILLIAQKLIDQGCDINNADDYGTVLMHAIRKGMYDVAELLLKKGAKIDNQENESILDQIIRADQEYLAKKVIEKTSRKITDDELAKLAEAGFTRCFQLLKEKGYDLNKKVKSGNTPLLYACRNKHRELAEFLMRNGGDMNESCSSGITPFLSSLTSGDKELAMLMLDSGADVNIADEDGQTALMKAIIWCKDAEIISRILEKDSDIEREENYLGSTALTDAIWRNEYHTIDLLLAHGADINRKNKYGFRPIMKPYIRKDEKMTEFLKARGAHLTAFDTLYIRWSYFKYDSLWGPRLVTVGR